MGILDRAELLLRAGRYSGSGDWLDESGNGHNGSISGATFLPFAGTRYFWLPGVTLNRLSTPDSAALKPAASISMRVTAKANWATMTGFIINRRITGNYGWAIYVSGGNLTGYAGNGFTDRNRSAAHGLSDGDTATIRADFTASTGQWNFYVDDVELSTPAAQITGDITYTGTVSPTVGANAVGAVPTGGAIEIYQAQVYADGALALDIHPNDATYPFTTFTERSSNAATVTIHKGSSGYCATVVEESKFAFDGTNDYIEIADHANLDFGLSDPLTVYAVYLSYTGSLGADAVFVKKDDLAVAGVGWALYHQQSVGSNFKVSDGTNSSVDIYDNTSSFYDVKIANAGVRNIADDDIESFVDGVGTGSPTTDASTGTLANALPARIGATSGTAGSFLWGEVYAVALFREALTDNEIYLAGRSLIKQVDDPQDLHGDALKTWIIENDSNWTSTMSTELVGLLNDLNGTTGKEYAEARATYLSVDPAG